MGELTAAHRKHSIKYLEDTLVLTWEAVMIACISTLN